MPPDLINSPGSPPDGNTSPGIPAAAPSAGSPLLAGFLSVFILLFLADGILSFADDSLILLKNAHALTNLRLLVGLAEFVATIVLYGLMALTPMIPKRLFLPLALFGPASLLLGIPFVIYHYEQAEWISWITSGVELLVGVGVFFLLRGRDKLGWPLVPLRYVTGPGFSWKNLIIFVLANGFVLLPLTLIYLFMCASMGINYYTDGFMKLHPGGFTMQARTYTRADGKTIQLFPMAHVAEADFYQNVEQTFPTNSIILMEGVTDEHNLLTNKISYKRMAQSLGLAEQHEKFVPQRGERVRADIDIDQFSTNTIALLNLVMMIHTRGVNAADVQTLVQYAPSPDFENQLFDDLLIKRNQHLLEEIRDKLPQTEYIVVPWGVAHMPGIAREIQKIGFHLQATRQYTVIRFFHHSDEGVHAVK